MGGVLINLPPMERPLNGIGLTKKICPLITFYPQAHRDKFFDKSGGCAVGCMPLNVPVGPKAVCPPIHRVYYDYYILTLIDNKGRRKHLQPRLMNAGLLVKTLVSIG
jgi:hypothetical protein